MAGGVIVSHHMAWKMSETGFGKGLPKRTGGGGGWETKTEPDGVTKRSRQPNREGDLPLLGRIILFHK